MLLTAKFLMFFNNLPFLLLLSKHFMQQNTNFAICPHIRQFLDFIEIFIIHTLPIGFAKHVRNILALDTFFIYHSCKQFDLFFSSLAFATLIGLDGVLQPYTKAMSCGYVGKLFQILAADLL